jgi:hypothetical protein
MPRTGYRSVALTEDAHEELTLLAVDLSKKCRRRLTLSEAVMIASEIVTDAPDADAAAAAEVHAHR